MRQFQAGRERKQRRQPTFCPEWLEGGRNQVPALGVDSLLELRCIFHVPVEGGQVVCGAPGWGPERSRDTWESPALDGTPHPRPGEITQG